LVSEISHLTCQIERLVSDYRYDRK
jgi:hypothetical protein